MAVVPPAAARACVRMLTAWGSLVADGVCCADNGRERTKRIEAKTNGRNRSTRIHPSRIASIHRAVVQETEGPINRAKGPRRRAEVASGQGRERVGPRDETLGNFRLLSAGL